MAQRVISCSLAEPTIKCLDDVAARLGRSRSGLIKEMLEQFLPLIDTQAHGPVRLIGQDSI